MNLQTEDALKVLSALGFKGRDVYLAELIPAVEMAWADDAIQPNERALLEVYCENLVEHLNQQAKFRRACLGINSLTEKATGLLKRRAHGLEGRVIGVAGIYALIIPVHW